MHKLYIGCGAQPREGSLANTDMSVSQNLFPPLPLNYIREAQHISSGATVFSRSPHSICTLARIPCNHFPGKHQRSISLSVPLICKVGAPRISTKSNHHAVMNALRGESLSISFVLEPARKRDRVKEDGGLSRDLMKVPTKKVRLTVHESKPMFVLEGPPAFSALCLFIHDEEARGVRRVWGKTDSWRNPCSLRLLLHLLQYL